MNRKLWRQALRIASATALLGALGGCGGGSSGQSSTSTTIDESPGGLFAGDVATGTSKYALISEAGIGWLYDDAISRGFAFTLDLTHTTLLSNEDVQIAGTIAAYNESTGAPTLSGTVQVSLKPHTGPMTLTYTLSDGTTGTYSLGYLPALYELPSALTTIAGSYPTVLSAGGATHLSNVTISSSGSFTGTDSSGCTYAGTVAVVNSVYNDYQLSNITETCSGSTVSGLSGQALVTPATSSAKQELTLSISNSAQQSNAALSE